MATYIKPEAVKDSSLPIEKINNVALSLADKVNALDDSNKALFLNKINAMPATPSGDPMHYAYVTAGAEYNDTGADIMKTAPWADMVDDDADKTVIHKAGYWYLNGLGDISNEEIRVIYNLTSGFPLSKYLDMFFQRETKTNFINFSVFPYTSFSTIYMCYSNKVIKVINLGRIIMGDDMSASFQDCKSLEHILMSGTISRAKKSVNTFKNCIMLKTVKLKNITISYDFSSSPYLTIKTILFALNNESAKSPITITLHHDAYARAMANADIVAALETHPLVSLASA